jgi:sec-independent protein translocase protein TatA
VIGDIIQPTHLLLILAIALLVLGPKRLPEVGRAVGRSIHGFRDEVSGAKKSLIAADEPALDEQK